MGEARRRRAIGEAAPDHPLVKWKPLYLNIPRDLWNRAHAKYDRDRAHDPKLPESFHQFCSDLMVNLFESVLAEEEAALKAQAEADAILEEKEKARVQEEDDRAREEDMGEAAVTEAQADPQ